MLNAAVNYQEHAIEMSRAGTFTPSDAVDPKVQQGIPGMWTRKPGDPRQNPYFFPKMPGAITGNGDPIILPTGRTQIDWECELDGRDRQDREERHRRASAADYIFGYTLENDVSDRGGRADGAAWIGLADRQEPRHLRPARTVHRAAAVRAEPAEARRSSSRSAAR